jgi:hypothetical protein
LESLIGRLAVAGAIGALAAAIGLSLEPSSGTTPGTAVAPRGSRMAQAPSIISGLVQDPSGRPVALARVYVVSAPVALPDLAMLTGADGTFRLAAPAEGRYQIGVSADGCAPASATAVVKGGQEVKLRLQLSPAASRAPQAR